MTSSDDRIPTHLAGGLPAESTDLLLERRAALVKPHIGSEHERLLDAGCGNGAQTFHFSDDVREITGLDINPTFLEAFRAEAARLQIQERVHALSYDGTVFPLPDGHFDFATSFEVLEHVEDESLFLCELFRTLRPGGTLAISVPNRWWIFETHGADLPLLPWNRVPFFSWLPTRIHDRYARARIYRKHEILDLLTRTGFEIRSSCHVTAPMDVVKHAGLRTALRSTIFRNHTTPFPFLSTSILVHARRP